MRKRLRKQKRNIKLHIRLDDGLIHSRYRNLSSRNTGAKILFTDNRQGGHV